MNVATGADQRPNLLITSSVFACCALADSIRNSLFSDLLLARSRSLSSRTISSANTRECSFGFLFVLSRRTAPCRASGNDVSSPRPVSRPFFFPLYLPFLPFGAHQPSRPLYYLFFPSPYISLSFSSSFVSPARRKPTYLPTYLTSLVVFFIRVWISSPVRYVKPLGDIFSRRSWRKKKPNISWRQIVIGACTTGTIPLSTSRSLVVGERIRRG